MKHRVRKFSYLVATAVFCFASSAFGDHLILISSPGGAQIGPYTTTVDGATTRLLSDDDTHAINFGEGWTATEETVAHIVNIDMGPGVEFPIASVADYEAAAWLVEQMFNPGTNNANLNEAIWEIFDGNAGHGEGALVGSAFASIGTAAAPNYADLDVYTYEPGTTITDQNDSDIPQEFLGVPESHTSSLLAAGLLALVALMI